ncbi:MAG TPA: carbohydrate ABC transporter permease [Clostridia bacterium]|nr:carbohydrate ABC transporter permease [Clostridia bacterium]
MRVGTGERVFRAANIAFLLSVVVVCLYPVYYVFVASVSLPTRIAAHSGVLFAPLGFTLEAYRRVMQNPAILVSYRNTLLYVGVGTSINLVMSCIGAYVLTLYHLRINRALRKFIVFTMFFSGGLIPMFLQVQRLGMINTMWALVVPSAINTYNMLIMHTAFRSIPVSLSESAKLDGATDLRILMRIILPLSLPILSTMVLYYGIDNWNSWFSAMVYLRARAKYPVQLILREILITSNTLSMTTDLATSDLMDVSHTIQYATIIVVILPTLFVYPFLQRYFIAGMAAGAVKG